MNNEYGTYVAYLDANSWTSERGASKFIDNMIKSESIGKGDLGCVFNGFKVVPSSSEGLYVTIKARSSVADKEDGHCLIRYNDYAYLGWLESDYELELEASAQALNRISYIVAYIDKTIEFEESDNIVEAPSVLKLVEVPGTDSATATAPTKNQIQNIVGVNNPYIILASINVPANTTRITSANITDLRKMAQLSGDVFLDYENSFTAGFYQPSPNLNQKTRIVITGPNASTPAAIPGIQLIWLKRKI